MGTYFPGPGTLGREVGLGLRLLAPEIIPNFYPPHVNVGQAYSESLAILLVWVDVVSLVP